MQKPVPGLYDSAATFGYARGGSFDDSDSSIYTNKISSKVRLVPENNLPKCLSVDKEKGSVAKIKVVVCFHSLFQWPIVLLAHLKNGWREPN